MRIPDFFKLGALLILGLAVLKLIFGKLLDTQNQEVVIIYWLLSGVYATALIRRGGVINYLESSGVAILWFILTLLFDYLVLGSKYFLGISFFTHLYVWIGYIVVAVCIFFFHKKRHVHIRRGGQIESHH